MRVQGLGGLGFRLQGLGCSWASRFPIALNNKCILLPTTTQVD